MAEHPGGPVDVRRDDLVEETFEFPIRQRDAVQGFELLPEVRLERSPVAKVGAVAVLEVPQPGDERFLDPAFGGGHRRSVSIALNDLQIGRVGNPEKDSANESDATFLSGSNATVAVPTISMSSIQIFHTRIAPARWRPIAH